MQTQTKNAHNYIQFFSSMQWDLTLTGKVSLDCKPTAIIKLLFQAGHRWPNPTPKRNCRIKFIKCCNNKKYHTVAKYQKVSVF
ncbi:hypothetical protein GDO86_004630 [Hymenochirus boettgeri]|uniref:Uncharacterized protein n=1 Tax=Hymenochirus boettgeri TaxID=247094 RepID=A0A8T2KBC9_9PIPI|nr:hypothetical protein GDO86_004630 [Hymenochirus boettgeri]